MVKVVSAIAVTCVTVNTINFRAVLRASTQTLVPLPLNIMEVCLVDPRLLQFPLRGDRRRIARWRREISACLPTWGCPRRRQRPMLAYPCQVRKVAPSGAGATANLACLKWLQRHAASPVKYGISAAGPYPAMASSKYGNMRLEQGHYAANIPVAIAGRRGTFTTFVDDSDSLALLRKGAFGAMEVGLLAQLLAPGESGRQCTAPRESCGALCFACGPTRAPNRANRDGVLCSMRGFV